MRRSPALLLVAIATSCCSGAQPSTGYTLRLQTDVDAGGGLVIINVSTSLAPLGAAHLRSLVEDHFYDGAAFFRVVPKFVVQFGIAGTPAENKKWQTAIVDDPVVGSNVEGTVTYATAGPNTRTTQLFINLGDNQRLDAQGFAPFGRVVQGIEIIRAISNPTPGKSGGVDQNAYTEKGDAWIRKAYPMINFILNATLAAQ